MSLGGRPTCLECARIRRGVDNQPDGEHVCGTCGDVWCRISRATFGDDIAEDVCVRVGIDDAEVCACT